MRHGRFRSNNRLNPRNSAAGSPQYAPPPAPGMFPAQFAQAAAVQGWIPFTIRKQNSLHGCEQTDFVINL
eukprot:gene17483-biopygen810